MIPLVDMKDETTTKTTLKNKDFYELKLLIFYPLNWKQTLQIYKIRFMLKLWMKKGNRFLLV